MRANLMPLGLLPLGLLLAAPVALAAPTFEAAYERERVELEALRDALKGQLKSQLERGAAKRQALNAQIERLTHAASRLQVEADDLEREVTRLEEGGALSADQSEALRTLVEEAEGALGVEAGAPKALGLGARLEILIHRAAAQARRGAEIHITDGAFFDAQGVERRGRLVHIGEVAALGLAEGVGGVLGPAPEGRLRLIDAAARPEVEALLNGAPPSALPVYLFDATKPPSPPKASRSLWDLAEAGGPIAWIILALAAIGLLLLLERLISLARGAAWRLGALGRFIEALSAGQRPALPGGLGRLRRVLEALLTDEGASRAALEQRASEQILRQMPHFDRGLALLNVIVVVSPLLGLLGTVTGIISTFDVITEHGTGDPKLLSQGISEALITTEFGLAVAIPLLLMKTAVTRWADRGVEIMQTQALALINALTRRGPR
ncbi:MotA/TolQ/ExbB proton channel family protein [Myxococcota bacterium]|nr:MotA/TolQ/ExbB proton channel family protein [Myxococcota bacterium]